MVTFSPRRDAGEPAPERWPDTKLTSMRLLDQLLTTDQPAYREAAARAAAHPHRRGRAAAAKALTVLVAMVIGLVLALGVRSLRIETPAADTHRQRLQEAVEQGQERVALQESQAAALRREVQDLDQAGAGAVDSDLNTALAAAAAQAALSEATGPGLTITLDDRRTVDRGQDRSRRGQGIPPERVQAQDMQLLVNSLWGAGAEAISINGHRLTAVSTIRWAVKALIVDFAPLAPPYTIEVIGPPEDLQRQLGDGSIGERIRLLQSYGVVTAIDPREDLHLEAGSAELFEAKPVQETAGPAEQGGKP